MSKQDKEVKQINRELKTIEKEQKLAENKGDSEGAIFWFLKKFRIVGTKKQS
jgi:hypothetical protein